VLLAIGRPDGRLCCLAKSESAVILAAKQAAFIQNPSYEDDSSGPDFITIGHNPYTPSMGFAKHVVLGSSARGKFCDEIIYERLHEAAVPVSGSVLRSLSPKVNGGVAREGEFKDLYGVQFVDSNVHKIEDAMSALFLDTKKFVAAMKSAAKKAERTVRERSVKGFVEAQVAVKNDDPAARTAFSAKLDSVACEIQDLQAHLQEFYECRIASLERYMAFCVLFHTVASSVNRPWLRYPWDIGRSQSNLRVATTAAPVTAGGGEAGELSAEMRKLAKKIRANLRGFSMTF